MSDPKVFQVTIDSTAFASLVAAVRDIAAATDDLIRKVVELEPRLEDREDR